MKHKKSEVAEKLEAQMGLRPLQYYKDAYEKEKDSEEKNGGLTPLADAVCTLIAIVLSILILIWVLSSGEY
ncbi:MAG: hypothetical protein DRZ79_02395 [Candidatus Cloacimonadota bacterium]|nr:MAG: hypothetical protein DRZ79_02395 [Candidatus Cloacimonadota bacterium]